MKILFLNAWDSSGGAAKAACRLLGGVRKAGVDARMLVKDKTSTDPSILEPKTFDKILGLLRPRVEGRLVRRYPQWNGLTFTPALLPDRLFHQVSTLDPDIVHLHWMADGFLRLETLARLNKPIVWTLHDSWPFTGGCHIPLECLRYRESCGECPALGSHRENDLSRKVWQRKSTAWRGLNLTVIAPSRWMAACARSSSLFRDTRIEVIPNGLDLRTYRPMDKSVAREALGLPQDRKLILFGGKSATEDPNKGFHLLVQALHELAGSSWHDAVELVVFGSPEPASPPEFGFTARYLGWLNDDISLALLYSAADVFVLPSIQESLGYAVMEAMACGTPCVAFNQGGVPDLIDHEVNGFLAKPYEPADLARGILRVLEGRDSSPELSSNARHKIENCFTIDAIAEQYTDLYNRLL